MASVDVAANENIPSGFWRQAVYPFIRTKAA
jgi:hypothetical protein